MNGSIWTTAILLSILQVHCQSVYFPREQQCSPNLVCTPFTQCPQSSRLLRQRSAPIMCGWRQSEPFVCCDGRSSNFPHIKPSRPILSHSNREVTTYLVEDKPFHPSYHLPPPPPPFFQRDRIRRPVPNLRRGLQGTGRDTIINVPSVSQPFEPLYFLNTSSKPKSVVFPSSLLTASSIATTPTLPSLPSIESNIINTASSSSYAQIPAKLEKELQEIRRLCGTRKRQTVLYVSNGNGVHSNSKWPWFASILITSQPQTHETLESTNSRNRVVLNLGREITEYFRKLDSNNTESQLNSPSNKHTSRSESGENLMKNLVHYCGASIITNKFLLTAAHCFAGGVADSKKLDRFRIGVGAVRTEQMELFEIEHVHLHPNNTRTQHYNDIALIELKKPLNFNARIRPLCLPFVGHYSFGHGSNAKAYLDDDLPLNAETIRAMFSRSSRALFRSYREEPILSSSRSVDQKNVEKSLELTQKLLTLEGIDVSIAGLGDTAYGGQRAELLQEAHLMLVNRHQCDLAYRKLNSPGLPVGINDQFVCAADPQIAHRFLNRSTASEEETNYRRFRRNSEDDQLDPSGLDLDSFLNPFNSTTALNVADNFRNKASSNKDATSLFAKEPADACQGDSGGPLVSLLNPYFLNMTSSQLTNHATNSNNYLTSEIERLNLDLETDSEELAQQDLEGRFYLVGVVSLGRRCSDMFPGVYVNINYHQKWILDVLSKSNL